MDGGAYEHDSDHGEIDGYNTEDHRDARVSTLADERCAPIVRARLIPVARTADPSVHSLGP